VQVIGNLLQNAAKFTGRGGATLVTVHAERAEKLAVIQVVDSGVGIETEMLSRLFQPSVRRIPARTSARADWG